jgi:hypothetical protein
MAGMKQRTGCVGAVVFVKCSKMIQYGMMPDGIKIIHKNIPHSKFR